MNQKWVPRWSVEWYVATQFPNGYGSSGKIRSALALLRCKILSIEMKRRAWFLRYTSFHYCVRIAINGIIIALCWIAASQRSQLTGRARAAITLVVAGCQEPIRDVATHLSLLLYLLLHRNHPSRRMFYETKGSIGRDSVWIHMRRFCHLDPKESDIQNVGKAWKIDAYYTPSMSLSLLVSVPRNPNATTPNSVAAPATAHSIPGLSVKVSVTNPRRKGTTI